MVTRVLADGERKEMSLPIIDKTRPTGYWLPRSVFQQLLYNEVRRTGFVLASRPFVLVVCVV